METSHFHNIVSVSSAMFYSALEHYKAKGLQWVDVPEIVGITGACENVDTLFKVSSHVKVPLFFTQTGQLALEQALQYTNGVFTVIHSGRDEGGEEDSRHLRQFRLTEEEFDCTTIGMSRDTYDEDVMYEELLAHIEQATKAMIAGVVNEHKDLLTNFYSRDVNALQEILKTPYLRVTYEESIEMLKLNGYDSLEFGDDLKAEHEAKIVELLNTRQGRGDNIQTWSPVFIMKYPKDIKFFNMKVSQADPRVVLSTDCVFPYSGESVGAAVREHDGIKLLIRLLTSNMFRIHQANGGKYEDFKWYTEDMILGQKTYPHAGYGIGNERIIQFTLGSNDIREGSTMSLMARQTRDWEVKA